MKTFFCIITNTMTIWPSNFRPNVIKAGNFWSTACTQWGVKGQPFSLRPSSNSTYVSKSVSDIWIQQGIVIKKIFGLWDFSHPVFGQFVLSYRNGQTALGKFIPNGAYLQLEVTVSQFHRHPSTHRVLFHRAIPLNNHTSPAEDY